MGTYAGAYSNRGYTHVPKEENKKIIIKKAECLGYTHIHGSWGDWEWDLTDDNGNVYNVETSRDYEGKNLLNTIATINHGRFEVQGL